jgi:hypothetical protein
MQTATHDRKIPELPDREPGIQLFDAGECERALHALVVDWLLADGCEGCWIDPGSHAHSGPLAELAPSDRILDRVHVARAFTPFQHLALVQSLAGGTDPLVVVPELDGYYRDDNLLAGEGREMLLTGLAALAAAARDGATVLVTRQRADEFSRAIETAADRRLRCEQTPFGPRFHTGESETLVYPAAGETVQTTLAFWRRVLAARRPRHEQAESPEVSARGAH